MKQTFQLLIFICLSSFLTEAYHLPSSLSDAAEDIKNRGWGRKKKVPVTHKPPPGGSYPKYFHEPDGSQALHHYDTRYHQSTLGYDDKANTQIHLIRSYLEFFAHNHLETWIAHGTLLGWWWNGKLLPWDWDIDTQVSFATMIHLAENHNGTRYPYVSKDTEFDPATSKQIPIARKYHLDVNPASFTRHRGDGANVIDARWIDVRNGLYIDITALAEIRPDDQPGIWACKNYHLYRTRDLWPMRDTIYEGVTAKVPYAYNRILTEEYGDASLVVDEFQGHKWSIIDAVWEKKTPEEIKREKADALSTKRKKVEEKAEQYRVESENQRMELYNKDEEARKAEERKEKEQMDKDEQAQGLKDALQPKEGDGGKGNRAME